MGVPDMEYRLSQDDSPDPQIERRIERIRMDGLERTWYEKLFQTRVPASSAVSKHPAPFNDDFSPTILATTKTELETLETRQGLFHYAINAVKTVSYTISHPLHPFRKHA